MVGTLVVERQGSVSSHPFVSQCLGGKIFGALVHDSTIRLNRGLVERFIPERTNIRGPIGFFGRDSVAPLCFWLSWLPGGLRGGAVAPVSCVLTQVCLQNPPPPVKAGAYGPNREGEEPRNLFVCQSLDIAQDHRGTENLGQTRHRSGDVVVEQAVEHSSMQVVSSCAGNRVLVMEVLQCVAADKLGVFRAFPVLIDKCIPQDPQEPRPDIRPPLILVPESVRLQVGLLNQIVCIGVVSGQEDGTLTKQPQVGNCLSFKSLVLDAGIYGHGIVLVGNGQLALRCHVLQGLSASAAVALQGSLRGTESERVEPKDASRERFRHLWWCDRMEDQQRQVSRVARSIPELPLASRWALDPSVNRFD